MSTSLNVLSMAYVFCAPFRRSATRIRSRVIFTRLLGQKYNARVSIVRKAQQPPDCRALRPRCCRDKWKAAALAAANSVLEHKRTEGSHLGVRACKSFKANDSLSACDYTGFAL